MTALADAKTRQKYQEEKRQKKESGTFGDVFKEACNEMQMKEEVAYHTSGYTREAKGFTNNVRMREYH